MGKIAFLYPGQGSQKIGMGADLLEHTPDLFERYLLQSEFVSGLPIVRYCLEGPIEALTQTQVAQPALFVHSLALTHYAQHNGLHPDFVAGHSLGEYTAAVVSGALSFEDGLSLVCQRGKLMHCVQNEKKGAMAAILGFSSTFVESLCQDAAPVGLVGIANINSPTQFVVSGEEKGVLRLVELVQATGTGKAILLRVSGAFHSTLMAPVQRDLHDIARLLQWRDAHVPIAVNVTGALHVEHLSIRQALLEQITSPVQWMACITSLREAGCDTFLEIGSGRVLTGLVRSIAPDAEVFAADSLQKIATFVKTHCDLIYRQ